MYQARFNNSHSAVEFTGDNSRRLCTYNEVADGNRREGEECAGGTLRGYKFN